MDKKNFTFEKFEPKQTKNKSIVKYTMRLRRKKGEITFADVRHYYDRMITKMGIEPEDIIIGAMTDKYLTMKSKYDDDLKEWDDEDYYKDRGSTTKKYNSYDFVDFTIFK